MTPAPSTSACAPTQAGLIYETLSGRSGSYVQQVLIRCNEMLDDDALRQAWLELVRRHRALRTSFVIGESSAPRLRVHDEVDLGVTTIDWRRLGHDEREGRWEELVSAERHTGFELGHPPLMRVAICRLGPSETRVLWSYHHAILDGRSRLALLSEVFELYDGKRYPPTEEQASSPSFERFAEWAAGRRIDPATEAFWRGAVAGIDAPTPAPGTALPTEAQDASENRCTAISHRLDRGLCDGLREMASTHDLTTATVLQGAYALLLAQESDQDDLLYAITRAGRRSAPFDTEEMIGLLMVTSAVRLRVQPHETVVRWLGAVRSFSLAVRDFEHAALSDLRHWSEIPHPQPIAETLFSYENASMNTLLRARDPVWERRDVQLIEQLEFPLTLETFGDREILVKVLYDPARVAHNEAVRLMSRYESLVRACVRAPSATVASACELGPQRRIELSGELSDLPPPAAEDLVPSRVREQIQRHPDRIAVEHGDQRLTYRQIGGRAEDLAARLADLGARPGTLVALAMERTPDLVCALLAVHRSGAAYVPLDPHYPPARLAFMLEDSGAEVVVTDAGSADVLPLTDRHAVLVVDAPPGKNPTRRGAPAPAPADLSHIIYTSGSTGVPKAVMVEHRSVAQRARWAEATFSDEERNGMLASSSLSFDLSVFEILVTLALGGRVVLVDNVLALSEPDFHHQIAFVHSVPSAVSELLRVRDLPASVRTVALAGEALPPALVDRLYAQPGVDAVWNLYGPSEDTTHSTAHRCVPGKRPWVGRPLPGTRAYVVDRHLCPVPEGVPGEVLLAGQGLARGYLKRPELTAESFLDLTFTDGTPIRVYRTGDRARWTEDGSLDYIGRRDDQVKIRGVRVEPGEVAHALRDLASIEDAAVVSRGEGAERRLIAYVVGANGVPPDERAVRSALAARLPAALRPSAIVVLAALPITHNGKLDRGALPDPSPRIPLSSEVLSNATQVALAELWREVLDRPGPIGASDDFFLLGGDSLSALHLLAAAEGRFGQRVSIGTLLSATTLAEQAIAIESARGEPATNTLIPLRLTGSRRPWFCVLTDQRGVIGLRNVLPAALIDQPVYAIQAIDPATASWRSSSVEQIAGACLRGVRSRFPHGPYRLGGHSLGGLVAFEMACRLAHDGERVELLVLLDTLAPEAHRWTGRMIALDRELRRESLIRRARGQAGVVRRAILEATALAHGDRRVYAWPRGFDDPWDRAGAHRIMRRYRPSKLHAPVTVLCTTFGEQIAAGSDLGWAQHVAGSVTTRPIPGDHVSIFTEPHVRDLAQALGVELEQLA